MDAPLLEMRSVTKDFPGVRALDGVSFDLRAGEIHTLCGENGAGKSTLIKILGGVWSHGTYDGEVLLDSRPLQLHTIRDAERAGIAVIHQELALVPEMSVAENLFLGREPSWRCVLDRRRMREESRVQLAAFGLDVDPRTPVGGLGVGVQQLVEIARALARRARILILDEPTAALTQAETETLHGILRGLRDEGVAMVYISHKLNEVFAIADRVTVLRDGRTIGTWDIGTFSPEQLIAHMVGRELSQLYPKTPYPPNKNGAVTLEVKDWTLPGPHGRPLLDRISFVARAGEILGIAGLMGAGRTELLMSLFGAWRTSAQGTLLLRGTPVTIRRPQDAFRHGLALVTEDRKRYGLLLDWDVTRNLSLASLERFSPKGIVQLLKERAQAESVVESLRIRTPSLNALVKTLSGGNQQKVVLGKWLMRAPDILFLDEPTRGIDVGAKAEMHALMDNLAQKGATVVMVSSELPEILGMSDRILVLHGGRVTGYFEDARRVTQEEILACATGRTTNGDGIR